MVSASNSGRPEGARGRPPKERPASAFSASVTKMTLVRVAPLGRHRSHLGSTRQLGSNHVYRRAGLARQRLSEVREDRCGLKLVDGYPKVSQDFNAIENAWAILRERLDETCPVDVEPRGDFVKRLRAAVRWANVHRSDQLWYLSTNQKERAADCLNSTPPGARTKW